MTLRGALNVSSASMIVASLLMAFFSYTVKSWVENVDAEIRDLKLQNSQQSPRIAQIETENRIRWESAEKRWMSIEGKVDLILKETRQ